MIYDTADGTTDGTEVLVAGSGAAITNIEVQLDSGLYVVNGGETPMTVLFTEA